MSKNIELAKNTLVLTVGKLCTQFVSFLLLPLYTALLDSSEYGIVDLFATYIALFLPIICWQFDQGMFRFMLDIREDKHKISELFTSLILTNFLQCLVFVALFIPVSFFFRSEYKFYLLLNVLFSLFSAMLMQFARGIGKMTVYSVGSFITATVTILFNIFFLVVLKMGAVGMFRATILGLAINVIYLTVATRAWAYFDIRKYNYELVKAVAQYSLPLVPNQISGWVLSASDRTIVSWFLGLTENGIYAVAYKFSGIVATFYGFFNMAWVESVSLHFHESDRDEFLSSMIYTVLGIFCSVCLGIIAIMPFAFPILVDVNYGQAFYHIPILLVAVVFQICVGLLSAVYLALKKSSVIARTTIVGAIINILVHLSLVKFVGLYAASVSTLVSYAAVAIYRYFDVKRYVNIRLHATYFISICVAFGLVTVCYYLRKPMLNIFALVFTIMFSGVLNRNFLTLLLKEGKQLLLKKGAKE